MQPPKPGPALLRATVSLDYQDVHLTAHDIFDPDGPIHHSVIEPTAFARRVVAERNSRQREGYRHARCSRVIVYRGRPHVDHDPVQNAACLAQARAWRANGGRMFGSLRPSGERRIWNTNLDRASYEASFDRTDYRSR